MSVDAFTADLKEYLETSGVTQEALSKRASVCQSQISDWKNGKLKRLGNNTKKVQRIIDEYRKSDEYPIPPVVEKAFRRVWSGKQQDAAAIASVIESLGSFR